MGHQCQWPASWHEGDLEMAHLQQLSQGGPDHVENVVMLCKHHHDVLDNRVVNKRRDAMLELLMAYLLLSQGSMFTVEFPK